MIPPWTSVAVITVQGEGWFNRMLTSPNDCFGPTVVYQPARIWSCSPANHTLSLFFTEQKCIKHYHLWLTRNISSFIFLYVWHMLCIWKPQGRSEAFLSTVFFNDPESWRMLHSPRPIKATNGQIFPSFTSTVNTDIRICLSRKQVNFQLNCNQ